MTTQTDRTGWRSELAVWVVVAVLMAAAFWFGPGPAAGTIIGIWMAIVIAVVHVGRRRIDAIRAVTGVGDERTQDLYVRATAAAGTVLWAVITGWWLLTVVRGEQSTELLVLELVFAVSFVGAAVVLARRS